MKERKRRLHTHPGTRRQRAFPLDAPLPQCRCYHSDRHPHYTPFVHVSAKHSIQLHGEDYQRKKDSIAQHGSNVHIHNKQTKRHIHARVPTYPDIHFKEMKRRISIGSHRTNFPSEIPAFSWKHHERRALTSCHVAARANDQLYTNIHTYVHTHTHIHIYASTFSLCQAMYHTIHVATEAGRGFPHGNNRMNE